MNSPLLITRGIIILPYSSDTLDVGRSMSINAITASTDLKKIVLLSQKDPSIDNPNPEDLYKVGTLCEITSLKKADDDSLTITFRGLKRVKILNIKIDGLDNQQNQQYYSCQYEVLKDINTTNPEVASKLKEIANILTVRNPKISDNDAKIIKQLFSNIKPTTNSKVIDIVANLLAMSTTKKQAILEEVDLTKRVELLSKLCIVDDEMSKIDRELNNKVAKSLNKGQKEFYLREKMKAIKEELGQLSSRESEVESFKKRVNENPYPKYIKDRVLSELAKIESTHPQEAALNLSYVQWLLDLPWWQMTKDSIDLSKVIKTLDESHYGLEKVKQRIIEYLAIKMRSPNSKAPIICLVGPPGVGKSTLAYSIAKSLNKTFVKAALGGIRDEAEIRGHRRTYLGSMPGRIIKAMKKAGVINPLFLLDEVDKMTSDMRGDPSSALLEVLDTEQNSRFSDNYIEEDYDLSKVMFVATANYPDQIPAPLYDRLEIIELTSYTEKEKLEIAKHYLIPKVLADSCVSKEELKFEDDAILYIIRHYTREAGVRELERLIRNITRKFAVKQQDKKIKSEVVNIAIVKEDLKKELFEYNIKDEKALPGVVNGMAYTAAGGDLLPIEATCFPGKGNIVITGNLKETMKESASVALGYVKANAEAFGLKNIDFSKIDIHIHVPSGGIPKDGPSAGVALTTAIISALSKKIVPSTISMTGEITLRGKVLIIGGIKEKVISAFRGGVNEIFIPKSDERYLDDVPQEVRDKIKFHLVEHYDEIFNSIFKR